MQLERIGADEKLFGTASAPDFTAAPAATQTAVEVQQAEIDREAYQRTLDSLFGYIILGICILAVLGAVLGFGSIRVRTGGSTGKSGSSPGSGGSSGGGGASGGW